MPHVLTPLDIVATGRVFSQSTKYVIVLTYVDIVAAGTDHLRRVKIAKKWP